MRKVFIDANILIAVLNKEYPLFTASARVLSLSDKNGFVLFTSSTCLAICFYFAEKKHGTIAAKQKIAILASHIKIAGCGQPEVTAALGNIKATDFEDALQYYSALHAKCDCIVTNDASGFFYSDMEVYKPHDFLQSLS